MRPAQAVTAARSAATAVIAASPEGQSPGSSVANWSLAPPGHPPPRSTRADFASWTRKAGGDGKALASRM